MENVVTQDKSRAKRSIGVILAIMAVLVIAVIIGMSVLGSSDKKVKKQLDLGSKYLEEMDYEQALIAYNAVLEMEPQNAEACLGIVEIYIRTKEFDKALAYAEEAYKITGDERLNKKIQEIAAIPKEGEKVQETVEEPKVEEILSIEMYTSIESDEESLKELVINTLTLVNDRVEHYRGENENFATFMSELEAKNFESYEQLEEIYDTENENVKKSLSQEMKWFDMAGSVGTTVFDEQDDKFFRPSYYDIGRHYLAYMVGYGLYGEIPEKEEITVIADNDYLITIDGHDFDVNFRVEWKSGDNTFEALISNMENKYVVIDVINAKDVESTLIAKNVPKSEPVQEVKVEDIQIDESWMSGMPAEWGGKLPEGVASIDDPQGDKWIYEESTGRVLYMTNKNGTWSKMPEPDELYSLGFDSVPNISDMGKPATPIGEGMPSYEEMIEMGGYRIPTAY